MWQKSFAWVSALSLALLFSLLFLLPGCGVNNKGPIADRKIDVVTTTGMITDIVQIVGGERVSVTGLMGPGVDPHSYDATEGDGIKMTMADVIFYNGLHLEGKMGEVFEEKGKRTRAVAVTAKMDPKRDLRDAPADYGAPHDPHVWFDVELWMKAVECVRDTLIDMDPTHAEIYRTNASKYLDQLKELHQYVLAQAEKVPQQHRVLITAHDAFYYFGRKYGFEVHGLQGVSTVDQTSPLALDKLARLIAAHRVPAIFIEDSVAPTGIEAVIKAVKSNSGFEVKLGGKLYSDAMGYPNTPSGNYIGMVKHNINTIVNALAPEKK